MSDQPDPRSGFSQDRYEQYVALDKAFRDACSREEKARKERDEMTERWRQANSAHALQVEELYGRISDLSMTLAKVMQCLVSKGSVTLADLEGMVQS